ncbi:MAG: sugar ABC transporter permease [Eubacteriales bacterium]|nr:sugar ABC transporter permease [Eubacteriales bacterium]
MKTKPVNYLIFILPTMLLFLLVFAVPLVVLLGTSFTNWRIGGEPVFNGVRNYIELFTADRAFRQGLINNIWWVVLQGTVHVTIGVLFGLILARRPFYWKFARTCYMIPSIISSAAMGMLFLCIFNAEFGLVNTVVSLLTGSKYTQNWFMSYDTSFLTVTLTWLPYAGITSLLVLTEITSIDGSILEAAIVDGADSLQINLRIILPLLKNIIGTCVILEASGMLKKLDIILLTTKGGPGVTTMNLPMYIYKTSMLENNFGLANAAGVILILLGCVTVAVSNRLFRIGEGA